MFKDFSQIATALRSQNATTLLSFQNIIHNSFKEKPMVESLELKYNVKDWIAPYIRPINNHTEPHAYKFVMNNATNLCEVFFKRFAVDPVWEPLDVLLSPIPVGNPPIVRPTWEKQCPIDDLRSKIRTCTYMLSNVEEQWWEKYITDLEKKQR